MIGSAPLGTSIRIDGAGRAHGLVAGAVVSVTVREALGPGMYRVSVGGKLFPARSQASFEPGSVFSARVERSGSGFILRARGAKSGGAAAAIARASLPDDPASRSALAALLREGAAPAERALARVRRAAMRDAASPRKASSSRDDRTDLAARLEAKGIAADEDRLDSLVAQSWAPDEGRGRDGSGGDRRGSGEGAAAQEGAAAAGAPALDPNEDIDLDPSEEELPRVLGALLRAMAGRADGEAGFLQLSNHVKGGNGSWIYMPFRFELDSVAFAGSFRLQLPCLRGGPGRIEASFEARREERIDAWSFALAYDGRGGKDLRLVPGDGDSLKTAVDGFASFRKELAAAGCSAALVTEQERSQARELDLDA